MVKIILIRHGESLANQHKSKIRKSAKTEAEAKQSMNKSRMTFQDKLANPTLSENGVKQCIKFKKIHENLLCTAKYVFVSPLERCVQTAKLMFDGIHPSTRDLEIRVVPKLSARMGSLWNIPFDFQQNLPTHFKVETSAFLKIESNQKLDEFFYFVDLLENKATVKYLKSQIQKIEEDIPSIQKKRIFFEVVTKLKSEQKNVEHKKDFMLRIERFKKFLKEFVQNNQIRDEEIVVVAHKQYLNFFSSEDIDTDSHSTLFTENCDHLIFDLKNN